MIVSIVTGDYSSETKNTQDHLLHDIRLGRNHLAFWTDSRNLFVFEVTNRPRQVQVAIDATKLIHKAASIPNPCQFAILLRFVVKTQRFGAATGSAQNSTRVSGICDCQFPTNQNGYNRSATRVNRVVRKITNLTRERGVRNERHVLRKT